jgi:hypothetical protein
METFLLIDPAHDLQAMDRLGLRHQISGSQLIKQSIILELFVSAKLEMSRSIDYLELGL